MVVDVGHTVEEPGARSARGVSEYDFNLRLATQIEQKLRDAGFAKTTLLITAEAPRAGLFKRAAYANEPGGRSVPLDPPQFGTGSFSGEMGVRRRGAIFSDRFKGHSIFISNDNADRKGSLLFGQLLGRQLKDRGLQYTRHYTEASWATGNAYWWMLAPASTATTNWSC